MSNLKNYEPMDLDTLDEQDSELSRFASSEFVKIEVGDNRYRFLPRQKGWKSHTKIIHEHFVDDVPGYQGTFRFACPRIVSNGRCPQCEKGDRLRKSRNPLDREKAKRCYPVQRVYANVIDRKDEDAGPRVITFGKSIWDQLKKIARDRGEGGDYTNPGEDGFDIIISRVGTGQFDTKYDVRAARTSSPLSDDPEEIGEWIDQQWKLDEYATCMESARLADMLEGDGASRQLPAARGSKTGRKSRPGRRRRTAQDDIESGEDDFPAGY